MHERVRRHGRCFCCEVSAAKLAGRKRRPRRRGDNEAGGDLDLVRRDESVARDAVEEQEPNSV